MRTEGKTGGRRAGKGDFGGSGSGLGAKIRSSAGVYCAMLIEKQRQEAGNMRYLDDILFLFGILCIVAAAFGVDWRLGFLALGAGLLVAGVFVGRFLSAHPEILAAADVRAGERALKRREKRGEGR